jgi:hypothetical protein
MFIDFGLYKCPLCGKMVMGHEKVNYVAEMHKDRRIELKKYEVKIAWKKTKQLPNQIPL